MSRRDKLTEDHLLELMTDLKSLQLIFETKKDADLLLAILPEPSKLRGLSLYTNNNEATEISAATISKFSNLTKLLSQYTLPQYLLPNLEYLNYCGDKITHLEANSKLTRLILDISLTDVTSQVTALTALKSISLGISEEDPTGKMFEFLTALTALENARFSAVGSQGPALWPYLIHAHNLTKLEVTAEPIDFTEKITCLTGLQTLNAHVGRQTHYISHLTNLTNLQVHYAVDQDESYIRKLTKLKSLVIYQDQGTYDLDRLDIADLTNLNDLNINAEVTSRLYESLGSLNNLTKFVLDKRPKESSSDPENGFTNLKHLDIDAQNSIGYFMNLAKLTNLHTLVLRFIEKAEYIDHLTTLTNLTRILFTGNLTKSTVTEKFSNIKRLYHVDVINRTLV